MKIIDLGLNTYTPTLDTGCDLIVERGNGELLQVQVKSSRTEKLSGKFQISTNSGCKKKTVLKSSDADVLAVHLQSIDTWYFIPIDMVIGMTTRIDPDREDCRLTNCKENWEIFK